MAQPFFGRRDSDSPAATRSPQAAPAPSPAVPVALQSAASAATPTALAGGQDSAARLTVGPHIKLKGVEITDCDTLFVEGTVEATMKSRVIEIATIGAFKGEAEVEVAEIHGRFEGNLTVRDRLVVRSTGRVTGKIRYGKLVVEEGGEFGGDVQVAGASAPGASALARVA